MLAVIQSAANALHDPGSVHPDQQARIDAINNQLIASGLGLRCPEL